VDLLRREVFNGRVAPDEVVVERRALVEPGQPGVLVGPPGGVQLGGEELPVAGEGGPDGVTGDRGQVGPPARFVGPVVNGSAAMGEARYLSSWFSDRSMLMRAGVRPAARPARRRSTACSSSRGIWRWRSRRAPAASGVGALIWGATTNSSAWKPVFWS
jgi:hypothetical protein